MAWALVTGAGTGIGRAVAEVLAPAVPRLLLVGRRPEPLAEAVAACSRHGADARAVAADVGSAEGRRLILQEAEAFSGGPALAVHNAAVLGPVRIASSWGEEHLCEWRSVMAANVEGPLLLTSALLPALQQPAGKQASRVLHVGSGAASRAIGGWMAYCTSKAALAAITRQLRCELQGQGVLVGCLQPGVVDTPMQAEIRRADPAAMPDRAYFDSLHSARAAGTNHFRGTGRRPHLSALDSSENVARFVRFVLLETPDQEFEAREEWNIHDSTLDGRWR